MASWGLPVLSSRCLGNSDSLTSSSLLMFWQHCPPLLGLATVILSLVVLIIRSFPCRHENSYLSSLVIPFISSLPH